LGRCDYIQRESDPATKQGHGAPKPTRVQRSQLAELVSIDFESWAKESFDIATKIAYRNGGRIEIPKAGAMDCAMVAAAPVLPAGYVVNASRIADRRMILTGYRLADLLTRIPNAPNQKRTQSLAHYAEHRVSGRFGNKICDLRFRCYVKEWPYDRQPGKVFF
jgi:hypothetical protein